MAVALVATTACSTPMSPTPGTGLTGVMLRGPTQPVCSAGATCEEPFSAGFTMEQNGQTAARFRSDPAGHFTVWIEPGTYRIVPDADAPIIAPSSQAKTVDVGAVGLTSVELHFDIGIR